MYGAPHGDYIQVWTSEQLPIARKIEEKNYIKEDAEFFATSASGNYEGRNYLPVDTMSTMKNYIKEETEFYTTPTFNFDYQTPVKLEEPLENFQTQSQDQKQEKESIFDTSTSTTDKLLATIKREAAAAEKAKAEAKAEAKADAKKRKNDVEDAKKRARQLRKNEAKRRRRRNMSEEKRRLEREKNTIRSKKWRDRKKLEKQMMENGEGVAGALKLELQSGSDYGEQEVVQVQSPARILFDDDTFPSSVDSILPTRESSQDTSSFSMSTSKKPRVTKLLTPEELEQRRDVYRRLSPEQKREHNRKVMERRKKRIEEMNEVERREHVLKEYAKYVERYRKRKEKMKNDTPEERKERLKGWRESKRRDRERKKLQQLEVKNEVEENGESCSNMPNEGEVVELKDISLCYGSYLIPTYCGGYEETGCQLGETNIYGVEEGSELKYL
ncbi:hypothetical protein CAEBREN_23163 [Caenorhabditis brenneri]|uniref:Uncharacterized protein n=1 Tax=Caenorhabditis brenneri TaxID=135651 RepID=G0MWX8_CAEBE|nr:hypothetical protein CAEBREN_23163 [Caenorhabditis brenneri]